MDNSHVTRPITTLAFDADDTLWHNETFFKLTQDRFETLLAPHSAASDLHDRLLETERRNIGRYGYGVKGFTLSMIEVAITVTEGRVPASVISEIIEAGREMLGHPVDLLPGVFDTLQALHPAYTLIVITKGDLLHQEEKLAASGLGDFFADVHIVSEKSPQTYRRILGTNADQTLMIGNSMRSDILPALEAGAWACHIPFEIEWALEAAEAPVQNPRFRQINAMAELPELLPQLR